MELIQIVKDNLSVMNAQLDMPVLTKVLIPLHVPQEVMPLQAQWPVQAATPVTFVHQLEDHWEFVQMVLIPLTTGHTV